MAAGDDFSKNIVDGFVADDWTVEKTAWGSPVVSIDNNVAMIVGAGQGNRLIYKKKIDVNEFKVNMKITPDMEISNAADLKLVFSSNPNCNSGRVNVRLHFKNDASDQNPKIYLANSTGVDLATEDKDAKRKQSNFTWTKGTPFVLEVSLNKGTKQVTVSLDGQPVSFAGDAFVPTSAMDYFAIEGQAANENFTIQDFKIIAKEDASTGGDNPPAPSFEDTHLPALDTILLADGFADSTKWEVQNSAKVEDGVGKFTVAGQEHRIGYKERIDADKFLVQMNIIPHMEKSACAADLKMAFMTAQKYAGERMHVRLHFQNSTDGTNNNTPKIILAKSTTDKMANEVADGKQIADFTWDKDTVIPLDILVDKTQKKITVYLNKQAVLSYQKDVLAITELGYFAMDCQWANQNFTIKDLKISKDSTAKIDPASIRKEALKYPKVEDTFDNDSKWTMTPVQTGSIAFGNKTVKMTSGATVPAVNSIKLKENIDVDKFFVQMDVTSNMEPGTDARLNVAFRSNSGNGGMDAALKFKDSKMTVGKSGDAAVSSEGDFVWRKGGLILLGVLVDQKNNKITAYQGGKEVASITCEDMTDMDLSRLEISGQGAGQNISISNLKITTDKAPADPNEGMHFLAPYSRVLAGDDFENGGGAWTTKLANSTSFVKFEGGKATIVGSGPCNRMAYQSKIEAKNMLIQFDLITNKENTQANSKFVFKAKDKTEDDRLQIRFNHVQGGIFLERIAKEGGWSKEHTYTDYITTDGKEKTYGVDILVQEDNVKVYINKELVLNETHPDVKSMAESWFAVEGQFPHQDFSIDNFKISTNEAGVGNQCTVTLKTATNGDEADSSGGTVTANALVGYSGDLIAMTVKPAHGYVLDKFTSYKTADGTSTDGLMPINNNSFTLDATKFGDVTVVAHFKTREPGRFELFYDDFAAGALDTKYVAKGDASGIVQADGALTISGGTNSNFLLLNQNIFEGKLKAEDGYRISVDVTRTAGTGTLQLMFCGSNNAIADRHVLGLNGTIAFIKPFAGGTGQTNLTQSGYTIGASKVRMVLEVQGSVITCYADGKEILKYASQDNWKNQPPAVGLINMTPAAPVQFDNLLVERIPPMTALSVKSMLREGGTLREDTTGAAGTLALNSYSAAEGDEIFLTPLAKAGYRLAECYVEGSDPKVSITDHSYTVPAGAVGSRCIVAVFEPAGLGIAKDCYIDSAGGNDSNPGTQAAPWKSFAPLKNPGLVLAPGSHIYLKRGSVFTGQQFTFNGMGTKEKPITVDAYGDGELPRLAGGGAVGEAGSDSEGDVVYLYNQEYITIRNLEITNLSPEYNSEFTLNASNNKKLALRAIHVVAKDFGTVSGIRIQDCYIHDINGNIDVKWNGGIFLNANADVEGGKPVGVPTKYDDVLIEGCTFINVDRSAVKLVGSGWCGQWEGTGKDNPTWYPSTNVVVRNNYLEKIGGDGITVRDTQGALVEHNLAKDCRYQNTGYNVAIWPFQASGTVIQYNEAYNTHSITDGQGLDCDHASSYSLMQYNYSHNNEGGFMLIMGGYPHTAVTVRYNISQNDYDKAFEFAQGIPRGVMIYNNTIYSKDKLAKGIFHLSNTGVGLGVNDFYLFNNLFCYPAEQTTYYSGEIDNIKKAIHLYNNAYVGGMQPPAEEKKALTIADTASVLVNAGSAPEANGTKIPRTGASGALDGYRLKDGSALIDTGVTMEEALTQFGLVGEVADGRSQSPRNLYEAAKAAAGKTSLNYVMGNHFPVVEGVRYDLDFFGSSNKMGAKPDIGAAEYPVPRQPDTSSDDSDDGSDDSSDAPQQTQTPVVPTPVPPVILPQVILPPAVNQNKPIIAIPVPIPVPATTDKLTVAAAASEKLPDNMELKMEEIPKEQKVVLEQQVTAGEHQKIFEGLQMEYVEIQLVQTEGGKETQVHDKQVTFVISLPKGVTKENYQDHHYFALHLKADGSTELIQPEATMYGLRVTSTLSSFALGYGLHEEDGGVTVKEATETAQGQIAYSCIDCGALIRTAALPALGKKEAPAAPAAPSAEAPKAEADAGGGISVMLIILCLAVLAAGGAGIWFLSRKREE